TPPVNTVTDAQVFLQYVKDAIIVIDAEKNNKYEVKKAKSLIEKADGKIIGAVLNKTPRDKSSSYYSYYGEEE
ncbi:CpsD/CapB family tyrosine-protein kinase, partial [Staphylococcus saprophyticus]